MNAIKQYLSQYSDLAHEVHSASWKIRQVKESEHLFYRWKITSPDGEVTYNEYGESLDYQLQLNLRKNHYVLEEEFDSIGFEKNTKAKIKSIEEKLNSSQIKLDFLIDDLPTLSPQKMLNALGNIDLESLKDLSHNFCKYEFLARVYQNV